MRTKSSTLQSLETITENGGHLVLVERGSKRPVWSRWQKRKPALDVVRAHDGRLGLVPYSIGSSALNVDSGDPRDLPTPWTQYRTQRRNGAHFYYGDDEARGNQKWHAAGCSGEVRGARGYLILHNGGAGPIARAIQSGRQMNLFPFPIDLLELHEAELIIPDPVKLHSVEPHGKVSLRLEGVYEGARNISLFEVGRQWAYRQRRGNDLGAWIAGVRDFFVRNNKRFPDPMHVAEVRASAYSVATWIWSRFAEIKPSKGKGPLDHSHMAQSWRGTWSGQARRRATAVRDAAIIQAVERGSSLRATASAYGLTHEGVRYIVCRGVK